MSVKEPPIYAQMIDESGKATMPWALFFDQVKSGDTGTAWTPTFTSLTSVGTPTITGIYYKLSDELTYFVITITPATSVTLVGGTTYCDFPLTIRSNGACFAVANNVGTIAGMVSTAGRIYVPDSGSAVTSPITIVGMMGAR